MRKDFEKYFTKLQLDYNRLQKDLEKINEEAAQGLVTEEQRNNFISYYNVVSSNYQRIAYARYLLRLPPKWLQKLESKIVTNKMKKELKKYEEENNDDKSVLKENEEALNKIEEDLNKCENS